jgi:hypothetical protein
MPTAVSAYVSFRNELQWCDKGTSSPNITYDGVITHKTACRAVSMRLSLCSCRHAVLLDVTAILWVCYDVYIVLSLGRDISILPPCQQG